MKILIVDDNKENLYLLESLLKGFGYEVITAINGKDALEKLSNDSFGMIISDILMPEMDGFQFIRNVKGDHRLSGMPFVFHTATYTDDKDKEFGLKLGACEYIEKPIDPEKFIKIIQTIFKDCKSGKLKPKKPVLEEEEVIYKIYNERLVKKLEHKMLELEKEILKRKQVEEEIKKQNENLDKLVKERTKELEEKNTELEHYKKLFVDREFRMKELREKVEELEKKLSE